jgi:ElaB/YqjD/DUF883 family membrane-anchored ribosome-binding protein
MNNRNGMGNDGMAANAGGLENLKDKVKGVVDQGQEKVHELKNKVVDVKQQAVTKGNEVLDKATSFIRANPIKAVGIAFGVGYIGMRLFRR